MSLYQADRIHKPKYFRLAPLVQGRGVRKIHVIGFDSEAHSCGLSKHRKCRENGYPFLYQFAHPDGSCNLVDVPRTGRKYETAFAFIEYLHRVCTRKDTEYIVFGFNLGYEYTQLWRDVNPSVYSNSRFLLGTKDEPSYLPDGTPFVVDVFNEKRYTFTIEWLKTKRRVKVVDAMAFLPTSLDGAAKMLGVGRKKTKPQTFDRGVSLSPEMIEYASHDAILTQRIGEWIIGIHDEYDVTQCISAPHFASKVFKRAFLAAEIPHPTPELEQDGLRSYHGGKNGFYHHRPFEEKGLWHVDIRSAYPEAMRALPDVSRSEWLFADRYQKGAHALWRVKGTYKRCRYRSLMSDGEWPVSGPIEIVCTGYELDSALEHGEIELQSCEGWMLVGPTGTGPLVEYVDTFYTMKRDARTTTERTAAKLFLNSLYGKFFQKVPQGNVGAVDLDTGEITYTDPAQRYDFVAGGLYHPPLASLITGYVRARIHGLEHRYQSLMTSTDGFFSRLPPDPDTLGKGLGQLSAERGTLRILRERVYVFDPDEPEHVDECKAGCTDRHPIYALHGFQGTVEDLRRMPLTPGNIYHYQAQRMVTLRMSTRRTAGTVHAPGEFVMEDRRLVIPGTTEISP